MYGIGRRWVPIGHESSGWIGKGSRNDVRYGDEFEAIGWKVPRMWYEHGHG